MATDVKAILRLEVDVIVVIATHRMPLRSVIELTPGAIIELPKSADAELDIHVGDRRIGVGKAVKVGENFGIRVAEIGAVEQRIEALGEVAAPKADSFGQAMSESDMDALAEQFLAGQ